MDDTSKGRSLPMGKRSQKLVIQGMVEGCEVILIKKPRPKGTCWLFSSPWGYPLGRKDCVYSLGIGGSEQDSWLQVINRQRKTQNEQSHGSHGGLCCPWSSPIWPLVKRVLSIVTGFKVLATPLLAYGELACKLGKWPPCLDPLLEAHLTIWQSHKVPSSRTWAGFQPPPASLDRYSVRLTQLLVAVLLGRPAAPEVPTQGVTETSGHILQM